MRFVIVLATCIVAASSVRAGWGSGGCAPVGGVQPVAYTTPFTGWSEGTDAGGNPVQYWYSNGVVAAMYNADLDVFRTYDGTWSSPLTPPWGKKCKCSCSPCKCKKDGKCCGMEGCTCCAECGPSCKCKGHCKCKEEGTKCNEPKAEEVEFNFGVDSAKIDAAPSYSKNGRPCSRAEALDAVSKIPDDAGKPRLTVIGTGREKVLADLTSIPNASKYVVKAYDANDWVVQSRGFVAGTPSIYIQQPDGKVLYHSTSYSPSSLAKALGDPAPATPSTPIQIPVWLYVAIAAVAGFFFGRKGK